MILCKTNSKQFIINSLADFILLKIGKDSNTKIQVVDCENFLIVKGFTDSKEVLELSEVISEFSNKYSVSLGERKLNSVIDLIVYDFKIDEVSSVSHTFHNTENCSYHYKQIEEYKNSESSIDFNFIPIKISENNLSYVSEFPYGHSLNQGRLLYYYLKKMFYSIPDNYIVTTMTMEIDTNKNPENIINVYDNFYGNYDETLKSAFLDHIDFNLKKFKEEILQVDWSKELENPLEEHDVLKENNFQIIII